MGALFNFAIGAYAIYSLGVPITTILTMIAMMAALMVWSLYTNQDKILYLPKAMPDHPTPATNPLTLRSPSERNMPYEDEYLTTRDGQRLHCWMITQAGALASQAPTVLMFHANAGNMGMRLPQIEVMHKSLMCNVFIVSYRGYGDSSGEPSEVGLEIDAETAMDHLLARTDIDTSRLFVQGCSLGGAVAISLLTKNKYGTQLCGAMLENTFVGISEMVDQLFPLLRPIKRHILKIHWPSRRRLEANCPCPVMLLSGRRDEVVPCSHMDLLIIAANAGADAFAASEAGSAFPKPKNQFIEIADGTHNDTWMKGAQAFFPAASAFMIEQVKVRSPIIAAAQRKAAGN